MTIVKSRADRLHEVLRAVAPKAAQYHDTHGHWPSADRDEDPALAASALSGKLQAEGTERMHADVQAEDTIRRRGFAPYTVNTMKDGRVRILVTKDDENQIAGTGADMDEALDMLEKEGAR